MEGALADQPDDLIPEERARAVWRRAAQLQAEAAQRLEERSRALATGSGGRGGDPSAPGFRRSDVEAAAVEAGISPEFVTLALAELGDSATEPVRLTGWEDRAATHLLGSERRKIEMSRTLAATPQDVLKAMQRVFPAHPYLLTLRDSVGDNPLEGGILIFDLPEQSALGINWFAYHMAAIDLKQLQVVLRRVPGIEKPACEVMMSSDMHFGVRRNWRVGAGVSAVAGLSGAGFGALVGMEVLALAAGLVALPVVAGAAVAGGVGAVGFGAAYRYYLRKAVEDLKKLLQTLDVNARTGGAFAPPQPPQSRNDGAIAAIIAAT